MDDSAAPNPASAPAADTSELDAFLGQKPRPRWRRWARFWVPALLVLLGAAAWLALSGRDAGPEYVTGEVTRRSLDLTVTATGNLRPTNQVQVGSEVSGRVEAIYADVNDRVARGQVLARINTDVIDDQIEQARANLAAARASIAQAQAGLDVSQAQLNRLREVYRLSGGKVPSRVELEQAVAAANRDRAAVASARASARANEAQLATAVTNRDRGVIRSPVAGVVLARQVESGQTVAASFSTPNLFIIAEDLAAMQLRVNVDEADVARVREGQQAHFTVDAYPGRRFPAAVERVDRAPTSTVSDVNAQAGQTPRTNAVVNYEARLSVANPDGLLRPGMTATATIATASTGPQLLVPNSALRFRPDAEAKAEGGVLNPEIGLRQNDQQATIGAGSRQAVHVLKPDGKFERIAVVTGESDGRVTVVRGAGLRAGMKVVTGRTADQP